MSSGRKDLHVTGSFTPSSSEDSKSSTKEINDLQKIRNMLTGQKFCFVNMLDEKANEIHGRIMATNSKDMEEFNGELWFFTNEKSAKVTELMEGHTKSVSCNFMDTSKNNYVSMSGTGEILRDKLEINKRWNPSLETWFEKGKDDPNLALLKVVINSAVYWDAPNSTMSHIKGFVERKLLHTSSKGNLGVNREVHFQHVH